MIHCHDRPPSVYTRGVDPTERANLEHAWRRLNIWTGIELFVWGVVGLMFLVALIAVTWFAFALF